MHVIVSLAVLSQPFDWRAHQFMRFTPLSRLQKHSSLVKPALKMRCAYREETMKKISYPLAALTLVLALVVPSLADTIRLKDGSVIHGQVIGFKDGQFTILVGGTKGRKGRTTVYAEDVESIEFDS